MKAKGTLKKFINNITPESLEATRVKMEEAIIEEAAEKYARASMVTADLEKYKVQVNGMGERYLVMNNPIVKDNTLQEWDKVLVAIVK
jgi:hypothetical protein